MPTNDNEDSLPKITPAMPDPHGHAALLLVESLIHGLIERSIISVVDAIDIIETADSVQVDVADATDGQNEPMWRSHALLTRIAESLRYDGNLWTTRPVQ